MDETPKPQGNVSNYGVLSSKSQTGSALPTARSPSILTAQSFTDPTGVPTALSQSATTAVGVSLSDVERNSGMSDTSAGSSLNTSESNMNTAKSPKVSEVILNDLRRGSIFGRQTQTQSQGSSIHKPQSVTNITFSSNPTTFSTASQLTEKDASFKEVRELKKDQMEKEISQERAPVVQEGKEQEQKPSAPQQKSRILEALKKKQKSSVDKSRASRRKSVNTESSANSQFSKKSKSGRGKKVTINEGSVNSELSKKSTKSKKKIKDQAVNHQTSTSSKSVSRKTKLKRRDGLDESASSKKSKKSAKKAAPPNLGNMVPPEVLNAMKPQPNADMSRNSDCGGSSYSSVRSEKQMDVSQSIRKVGNKDAEKSVRIADATAVPPAGANGAKYVAKPAAKKPSANQSTYLFPGAGQCTRSYDSIVPISQNSNAAPQQENHRVYDVSKLTSAQRQMPAKLDLSRGGNACTLFGSKTRRNPIPKSTKQIKTQQASNRQELPSLPSLPPFQHQQPAAASNSISANNCNKVVVYGTTPDGKHQVEFTIHMRLVSGEALGLSNEPVEMVPKKVVVGGREIPIDLPQKK